MKRLLKELNVSCMNDEVKKKKVQEEVVRNRHGWINPLGATNAYGSPLPLLVISAICFLH